MRRIESSRIRTLSGVALLALCLGGCASNNIRSDYDRNVDFSEYETYNFFQDAGPDGSNYRSFFTEYMIDAISREMEQRGYVRSDDPDLLVNFNARLQEKTDVRTTPSTSMRGYYGYRGGFYDPWYGYGFATETHVSQYTEGTFNIDLVDAKRKKLVWEAVGVGRVTQKDLDNLRERVNTAVPRAFANYPFRAGSSEPVGDM